MFALLSLSSILPSFPYDTRCFYAPLSTQNERSHSPAIITTIPIFLHYPLLLCHTIYIRVDALTFSSSSLLMCTMLRKTLVSSSSAAASCTHGGMPSARRFSLISHFWNEKRFKPVACRFHGCIKSVRVLNAPQDTSGMRAGSSLADQRAWNSC